MFTLCLILPGMTKLNKNLHTPFCIPLIPYPPILHTAIPPTSIPQILYPILQLFSPAGSQNCRPGLTIIFHTHTHQHTPIPYTPYHIPNITYHILHTLFCRTLGRSGLTIVLQETNYYCNSFNNSTTTEVTTVHTLI